MRAWRASRSGALGVQDYIGALDAAILQLTVSTVQAGFRHSGLFPHNRDALSDTVLLPHKQSADRKEAIVQEVTQLYSRLSPDFKE